MHSKLSYIKKLKGENKWRVYSKGGRNLGTYDSESDAKKRLQQIHFFKNNAEDGELENDAKDITDTFDIEEGDFPQNLRVMVVNHTASKLAGLERWLHDAEMHSESEAVASLLLAHKAQ